MKILDQNPKFEVFFFVFEMFIFDNQCDFSLIQSQILNKKDLKKKEIKTIKMKNLMLNNNNKSVDKFSVVDFE